MADHQSDVFTICTCNDISKLPPEFSRNERFDGVWFLDLPGVGQKRAIWKLYVEMFGLDPKQPKPVDADWTSAEIRALCGQQHKARIWATVFDVDTSKSGLVWV